MIASKLNQLAHSGSSAPRQRARIIAALRSVQSHQPRRAIRIVVAVLAAGMLGALWAQEADEALARVRADIRALESRIAEQIEARDAGADRLRKAELAIVAATEALARLRTELDLQEKRLRDLNAAAAKTRERIRGEQDSLDQQVRLSYMVGRDELLKLLLSQENPAELSRMLTYYDYFNRFRAERIAAAGEEMRELIRISEAAGDSERDLRRLTEAQSENLTELAAARDSRAAALARLESELAESDNRMEELRQEESRLAELLAELDDILAAFPVEADEPIEHLKGKLVWPIEGRVIGDYGEPREGGPMRWSGVMLGSAYGTPVRAIYRGRVAFSDWLRGYGLLMIVEHGDGYLSLYGNNEVLLKQEGDWVEAGEVVARVGDTGGQTEPALYFELRRDGKPVNPHDWIRAAP
jgi:septal ring factor EnvC (AmiA/AmiB activator)